MSLFDQLQYRAGHEPSRTALIDDRTAVATTYGQLATDARRLAATFHAHLPDQAFVPILGGRTAACVAAMFGALGCGKAFACLNRKLRAPQIVAALGPMRSSVAFAE